MYVMAPLVNATSAVGADQLTSMVSPLAVADTAPVFSSTTLELWAMLISNMLVVVLAPAPMTLMNHAPVVAPKLAHELEATLYSWLAAGGRNTSSHLEASWHRKACTEPEHDSSCTTRSVVVLGFK